MKTQKKEVYVAFLILLAVLISSIASAGFADFFKKITGKIGEQPQNITITVVGVNPAVINYVSLAFGSIAPLEGDKRTITFEVHMYDLDGVSDLDDTSVNASFSRLGEPTRTSGDSGSCLYQNDISSYTANYSCSIDMWYWDESGDWQITVQGRDLGNGTWQFNDTTTFTYQELKAMVIYPMELTWPPVIPGSENQSSNNDPTIINNTGNYDGNIKVNAINLLGESDPSQLINAEDFTIGTDGNQEPTYPECVPPATLLVNGSDVSILNSNANRGNLSAGSGQEELYYCIPTFPLIVSQTYSTRQGGSWTIAY